MCELLRKKTNSSEKITGYRFEWRHVQFFDHKTAHYKATTIQSVCTMHSNQFIYQMAIKFILFILKVGQCPQTMLDLIWFLPLSSFLAKKSLTVSRNLRKIRYFNVKNVLCLIFFYRDYTDSTEHL